MTTDSSAASVSRGYDLWASAYDTFDNPLVALSERALAEAGLPFPGAHVVELGCGTGRNAVRALASGAARYVGLDGSPGMLARAEGRQLERATFREGDMNTLQGDLVNQFDVALICLALEHVEDAAPALAALAAYLRPGGVALVHELDAERHAAGVAAHFEHDGSTVRLPSYPHDLAELSAGLERGQCDVTRAARLTARSDDRGRSPKLARYLDTPLLIEVLARRR